MQIIPFKAILDIPSGNIHKGNVEIFAGKSLMKLSHDFPSHEVYKKNEFSKFVTSIILNGAAHVFYDGKGKCIGVEIFCSEQGQDYELLWDDVSLFKQPLEDVVGIFIERGFEIKKEVGDIDCFEIPQLGITCTLSEEIDGAQKKIETVYVQLTQKDG